jgi:hypothetical protein
MLMCDPAHGADADVYVADDVIDVDAGAAAADNDGENLS